MIKDGVPANLIDVCDADVVPIGTLFERHAIRNVDLLQVEVEGFDHEVLKMVLATGIRPAIINYEHCHLVPEIRNAAKQLLIEQGYRFVEIGKDALSVSA